MAMNNATAPELLKEMLARIGGGGITQDLHFDTDSGSFLIAGVPAPHWDAHAFADAQVRPALRLSWPAERQPEARDLRLRLSAGAQLRWVSLVVVTGLTRSAVALR